MHVYEVFVKRDGREEFRHVGALEAADDQPGDSCWPERRTFGGPRATACGSCAATM